MGKEKLVKVSAASAAAIGRELSLSGRARKLLSAELAPQDYLELLLQEELFLDAIRFLCQALPAREGVFWACLCTRQMAACPHMALAQQTALRSAAAWVLQPTEQTRMTARAAGERAKLSNPAGCAALAASWAGADQDDDDASRHLSARAAAAAVMIAAASGPVAQLEQRYRQFLDLGLQVAAGLCGWEMDDKTTESS